MTQAKQRGPHDPFERWKTAPFVTEWCGATLAPSEMALGDRQVQRYHISALSSGNYPMRYAGMSAADQRHVVHANKSAGYRYRLASLETPARIASGARFTMVATWANDGIAPLYDQWRVTLQLRDRSGRLAWDALSRLDLRTVLPTGRQFRRVTDHFTIPRGLAPGSYQLSLIVVDPHGYLRPLALAIKGRGSDGGYALGWVTVGPPT